MKGLFGEFFVKKGCIIKIVTLHRFCFFNSISL